MQAVADEDAAAAFDLAGRAVEMGYDLRLVCRELSRVVRDLLVLSVDPVARPAIRRSPARASAIGCWRWPARFSREDLLRAFDLLTKAESDIQGAAQPRYHLEMALLRWIYLRKLMPIEDLIAGTGTRSLPRRRRRRGRPPRSRAATPAAQSACSPPAAPVPPRRAQDVAAPVSAPAPAGSNMAPASAGCKHGAGASRRFQGRAAGRDPQVQAGVLQYRRRAGAEDRRRCRHASRSRSRATRDALRPMFEQNRSWLEALAEKLAGRKIVVDSTQASAEPAAALIRAVGRATAAGGAAARRQAGRKTALKEQALADAGVQALLEVFPAEIRDVEEM